MFTMIHENYNVRDLDRSLAFYREALGLHECAATKSRNSPSSLWRMTPKPSSWN